MPHIPVSGGSSSGNEEMSYPIDLLRETAAKILANANLALDEHTRNWSAVQAYINSNGPRPFNFWSPDQQSYDIQFDVRPYLENVLAPHAQRLHESYQWQIQFATALFAAIAIVEGADNDVAQSFRSSHGFGRDSIE
jgi:hypothetical protein